MDGPPGQVPRRVAIAALSGLACVIATAMAIRGPANQTAETIRWPGPPGTHRIQGPAPAGTPLLLANRFPAQLTVDAHCAPTEQRSTPPTSDIVILATARRPIIATALQLTLTTDRRVVLNSGSKRIVSASVPSTRACSIHFQVTDDRWLLRVSGRRPLSGRVPLRNVAGLYSDLVGPDRSNDAITTTLRTESQDSSPSARQLAGTTVAGLLAAGSMLMLRSSGEDRILERRRPDRLDGVVAATLVAYAVVGTPQPDDGWFLATVANERRSGTFGFYYDQLNLRTGFGFVHYRLLGVFRSFGDSLLVARLPAVICGVATWWICRGIAWRRGFARGSHSWPLWTLAAVFCLGWTANNVTARPEPLVALLVVIVVNGVWSFATTSRLEALVAPAVAAALAVGVHPEGAVSLAPLLFAAPTAWRLLRTHRPQALVWLGTLGMTASATAALLFFADSDLGIAQDTSARLATATTVYGGVSNEWERYRDLLVRPGFGVPVRRVAMLIPVALAAFLLVRTWRRGFAGRATHAREPLLLLTTMAALAPSPSKWPFHLGVVVGPAALVAGAWAYDVLSRTTHRRPFLELSLAALALAALSWVALRRPASPAMNDLVPIGQWLDSSAPVATAAAVGVMAVVAVARLRSRDPDPPPVGLAIPVVVATAWVAVVGGLYALDGTFGSESWTLPRQLVGATSSRCGLAGVIEVAIPGHGPPLLVGDAAGDFLTEPRDREPVEESLASPATTSSRQEVTTGTWRLDDRTRRSALVIMASVRPGLLPTVEFLDTAGRVVHRRALVRPGDVGSSWHPSVIEVPPSPSVATVRLVAVLPKRTPPGAVRLRAPHRAEWRNLAGVIGAPGQATLESQGLAVSLTCARLPVIASGIVQIPALMVWSPANNRPDLIIRSPWVMANDAYDGSELAVRSQVGALAERLRVFEFDDSSLRPFETAYRPSATDSDGAG